MNLPADYEAIFRDRVLFITGTGRTGTTILGRLIATMSPVYYLFEPALLLLCDWEKGDFIRATLFEDYFLPEIHGRCNPNPNDWTHWGHTWGKAEVENRWKSVRKALSGTVRPCTHRLLILKQGCKDRSLMPLEMSSSTDPTLCCRTILRRMIRPR